MRELSMAHPGWHRSGHFLSMDPIHAAKLKLLGSFYASSKSAVETKESTDFGNPFKQLAACNEFQSMHKLVTVEQFVHGNAKCLEGWAEQW